MLSNRNKWLILIILSLVCNFVMALFSANQAKADTQFFPETGKTISDKFLEYWRNNGGLKIFGYPISDAQLEIDPESSKTYLTQWFERNRFEYHPEKAGTKYEVLLGLLGKQIRQEALTIDPYFQVVAQSLDPNLALTQQTYFTETGHKLRGEFLEYWQRNGGLERFGYPISETYEELDLTTDKVYLMQWFERARFEYHPQNSASDRVQLGLLGAQLKNPTHKVEFLWQFDLKSFGLIQPTELVIDSQANMYVGDSATGYIYKFDRKGQLLVRWGGEGSNPEQFNSLMEISIDGQNNIIVLEPV